MNTDRVCVPVDNIMTGDGSLGKSEENGEKEEGRPEKKRKPTTEDMKVKGDKTQVEKGPRARKMQQRTDKRGEDKVGV